MTMLLMTRPSISCFFSNAALYGGCVLQILLEAGADPLQADDHNLIPVETANKTARWVMNAFLFFVDGITHTGTEIK